MKNEFHVKQQLWRYEYATNTIITH